MNKKKRVTGCLFFLLCVLASCGSVKDITYLQSDGLLTRVSGIDTFELHIQVDDLLDITVNSMDETLTKPFNLQPIVGNGTSSYQQPQGFLVDKNGYINYPVLGKMKVAGLTRRNLIETLQNRLSEEGYIKEPIVTVRISNFRVTVLGEVNRPGTYHIDTECITLFEALGQAGDLTLYGRRDRVAVMREINGVRTILYHDLRSVEVMKSPFFYLRQNDMVYVEPNRIRAEASSQNQFSNVGTWVSLLSLLSTLGVLLFK